jgi:hypothetical protein
MENELKRSVEVYPAYDKRDSDPKKNYGIGSATLKFLLSGPKGTIQFAILTGWHLPHVEKELKRKGHTVEPMGLDLGYHAHTQQYEGQEVMKGDCEYLGGPCYYDGTSLGAETLFQTLLEKGMEAVWAKMQERYENLA